MVSSVSFSPLAEDFERFELENSSKDAYTKVLTLAVGSFLGDAAFTLRKKNDSNRSKSSARGEKETEETI